MSTFIIRNKVTKEQWSASSGKNSWRKINHAKAAFSYSQGWLKRDPLLKGFVDKLGKYESLYFDDQDVYEIVELLSESEDKLKQLQELLEKKAILLSAYPEGKEHEDCMKLISEIAKIVGCEGLDCSEVDHEVYEFEKRKILAQVAYWEYYRSVVLPLMKDDISKQWELTAKVAEEGILCK